MASPFPRAPWLACASKRKSSAWRWSPSLQRNGPIMINHELAAIPLHPFTIDEVYVFIATDATGEGVPAIRVGDLVLPLFGADVAPRGTVKQTGPTGGPRGGRKKQ